MVVAFYPAVVRRAASVWPSRRPASDLLLAERPAIPIEGTPPEGKPHSLPFSSLRGDAAFRRVRARGKAGRNALLTLRWLPQRRPEVTVGIVASKKVGNAVTRNLVRRRVREAARRQDWPACEVMLVMTPESARASYRQLLAALNLAAGKAGLRQAE